MRRLVWVALWMLACRGNIPAPEVGPPVSLVRPGATGGDGSAARPFGSLARALAEGEHRLQLAPGRHAAPEAPLARDVALLGERGARVAGRLLVSGSTVSVEGLWLEGGLELRTGRARVQSSTIGAAGEEDALNAYRARVELRDVQIQAGPRAGVYALGSTLSLSRVGISGPTQRSLVSEGSRLRLVEVDLDQATLAHAISSESRGRLTQVRTSSSARVGWVAKASRLRFEHSRLAGLRHALLANQSELDVEDSRLERSQVFGLGANGSTLSLARSEVEAEGGGVSVAVGSRLSLDSSTIAFAQSDGLLVTDAEVEAVDLALLGGALSRDGLVLHGARSRAQLKRTRIGGTSGWAVVLTQDAALQVDSSTIGPSGGGLWVQDGFRGRSHLARSLVRGCFGEAGLRFERAWVRIDYVRFEACSVVGAQLGELQAKEGRFMSGLQLFGSSRAELSGGLAQGEPWSVFCTPDSELLLEDTTVRGQTPGCRLPPQAPQAPNQVP
ncbi:MAG: hypothetical protein AAGD10_00730 [Myxococcota bacterium]